MTWKHSLTASVTLVILQVGSGPFRCAATEFTGKVIGVSEGDTITVLREGNVQEKVRLQGIDCPESGQAFGAMAKNFTSGKVLGQVVRVVVSEKDKYGRTIGDVYLPDRTILNADLVKAGMAWWHRKYAPDDEVLAQLETAARSAKIGLWADPNPIAPWDFRANPPPVESVAPKVSSPKAAPVQDVTVYVTRTGSKYHRLSCRYLKSVIAMPLSQAKARYSPCSVCRPPQ